MGEQVSKGGAIVVDTGRSYTVKELEDLTGLGGSYISRLLRSGKLRGTKRAGSWFVSGAEVRRWLALRAADEG